MSDSTADLKYLIDMIQKDCGDCLAEFHCRLIKEVIKDVYGGIRYEQGSEFDNDGVDERS